jgi:hypothetical protein
MKQLKVNLPDDLRARLDAASAKSGQSVAEEIRSRVEQSFAQEAVDKPARDLFEGLTLMPAEIELETGAAWHKHAGAHEAFVQAILSRLLRFKPKGSMAFGDRPHATILDDDPNLLGVLIEGRLHQLPDFSNSPARQLMKEEYQKKLPTRRLMDEELRKRPGINIARPIPKDKLGTPFDEPTKGGKKK